MTSNVPQTERISLAAAVAMILKAHRMQNLPFPYEIGQNGVGSDMLCIDFNTIADLERWATEAFQHDKAPSVHRDELNQCMSSSLHIWGWKGWTVALRATDPLPTRVHLAAPDDKQACETWGGHGPDHTTTTTLAEATCPSCLAELAAYKDDAPASVTA